MATQPDGTEVIYAGPLRRGRTGLCRDQRYVEFRRGVPVKVSPELAAVLAQKPEWVVGAQPFSRLLENHTSGDIMVRRFGALGDLVMLRAVIWALRKRFPQFRFGLQCQRRYAGLFKHDPLWLEVVSDVQRPTYSYLGELYLDGVVEVDHSGEEESRSHRVDLFWEHLVKDFNTELARELDWDIPVGQESFDFAEGYLRARGLAREERVRPFVGVQVRGSGPMKSLPPAEVEYLVDRLVQADYDVLLIDQQANPVLAMSEHVYEAPGRSVLDVVALMRALDAVVCMDSGVLWLSHIAKVPTITLLGPTRPQERIAMHPLYEDGLVEAICLNEMVGIRGKVGCSACFENAKACGFKYSCMTVPVREFEDELLRLLGEFTGSRRLSYERRKRALSEV